MTAKFTSTDLVTTLLETDEINLKGTLDRYADWQSDLKRMGFHPEYYGDGLEWRFWSGKRMISVKPNKGDQSVSMIVWRTSDAGFWHVLKEFEFVNNLSVAPKAQGLLWTYFRVRP